MNTTAIIKRLRASGLSQSEISRRTGVPQPRLSRWEAGETPAGADDALKLRALLDGISSVSPDGTASPTEREAA